jgi:4-amino-4-deoxy-L-arabinose transferase-like glycosyltransferase
VNSPTPAIVAQSAVRRLPRIALLLFCIAYVLPGFLGRDAWKSADMAALGYMAELAQGTARWLTPTLMGTAPEHPALLPYWIGAWAIQIAPDWIPADFAVRLPFGLFLALALIATWYGTYYLGRTPRAQPVAFAFGGEALPTDYARAMADAGLLAFIASLGLAQLSHETTPALAQLGWTALLFYGTSALHYRRWGPAIAAGVGMAGLSLSGAPALAALLGVGSAIIHGLDQSTENEETRRSDSIRLESAALLGWTLLVGLLAYHLDQWRWIVRLPDATWSQWNGIAQLLIWFTWPALPLALWTLWRWRHHLFNGPVSRHLALPTWFVMVPLVATALTGSSDRTLLLALPSMAALAAFALPTLQRSVAALIDWFTLLFFSGCGIIIWVVWIAMQTGVPAQPAANVARLAPGFTPSFSSLAFACALAATLVWAWLVNWRVGRHRAAIWKSLVLPAGGAAMCWLLLMTLWMPLLNYAQSYKALVQRTMVHLDTTQCAQSLGLSQGQIAAFQFYGKLKMRALDSTEACPWMLAEPGPDYAPPLNIDTLQWEPVSLAEHPADDRLNVLIYKRRR